MDWMIMPLKRYADFQGRSRRKEYWMFTLGVIIATIALTLLLAIIFGGTSALNSDAGPSTVVVGVLVVVLLGLIIPSLAVQVRRFHDQDKSGWFILLSLIPYIGSFIILVFMCIDGTRGPNRFGPDPKDPDGRLSDVFN